MSITWRLEEPRHHTITLILQVFDAISSEMYNSGQENQVVSERICQIYQFYQIKRPPPPFPPTVLCVVFSRNTIRLPLHKHPRHETFTNRGTARILVEFSRVPDTPSQQCRRPRQFQNDFINTMQREIIPSNIGGTYITNVLP